MTKHFSQTGFATAKGFGCHRCTKNSSPRHSGMKKASPLVAVEGRAGVLKAEAS